MTEPDLARFLTAFTVGRIARFTDTAPAAPRVAENTPIAEVVLILDVDERVGVTWADGRIGVVERSDLDGLLVRAWLFGLVTALERRLRTDLAAQQSWQQLLSPERLQRARDLKLERGRRGQAVDTMACLQFGDLGQMGVRVSWWQGLLGLGSNRQAKELAKRLELLRNDLAHGQDVIAQHWETVVALAGNVRALAEGETDAKKP